MQQNPETGERPRRRSRRRVVLGSVAAVVVLGVAVAAAVGFGGGRAKAPQKQEPAATAVVTRADLSDVKSVKGVLGFGAVTKLDAQLTGTVTALAPVGSTVERGKTLCSVDDQPVVLFHGALPMWRKLQSGVSGRDVKQLEENLKALGYTGFTVDESFDAATAGAVRRWQDKLGLQQTGTVDLGRVVFAPGAVRIAEHRATVGARLPGPVLGYTGTTRVATVQLPPADQRLGAVGAKVTVQVQGGGTVPGTVAEATRSAAPTTGGGQSNGAAADLTVTVAIADQDKLGVGGESSVDVQFVSAERKGVLVVPVTALLALREGGYGVEVVDGTSSRIVAVEVGLFAGGRVEIAGEGVAEGIRVKVPA